jgi:predicted dehydrogenase
MRPISVLVLGTGFWGNEWLRTLPTIEGVVIAGTGGHHKPELPPDAPLAPDYREFDDYKDAIAGVHADAVIIALPTPLHPDAILRALDAGMHVLCEKPLASRPEEVAELLAAAAEHPELTVMVQQNYRRRPWAQLVRSQIEDGTVGTVGHIAVRFRQPEMPLGLRAELDNPLLQDMGIHHMDLLRFLSGRNAVELYARQYRPSWSEFKGAPGLDAIITMEGGLEVSYSGSWAGRGRSTEWDGDWAIEGDRGLLTVTDLEVAFHPTAENDPTNTETPVVEPVPIEVPDLPQGDLPISFEHFRRAIEDGREPDTGINDNCHSIAMVFAAEEAIREGRPVQVESWAGNSAPSRRVTQEEVR